VIEKLSQLWKGRAVEDALPGEEGGAVKLDCQECGEQWHKRKPAGAENSAGKGGCVAACSDHFRSYHCELKDLNSDLLITKKRCYPLR
jgi:hypothetical protein